MLCVYLGYSVFVIQVRSKKLLCITVELNSVFLGPNEVSMMYAVGFMPKISERYAFESYAPKDLCVDI